MPVFLTPFLLSRLSGLLFPALVFNAGKPGVELRPPHSSGSTSAAEISLWIFNCLSWVYNQPVPHLRPSYQSQCGCFFISFSDRASLQPVFRWLSRLIVL